MTERAAVAGLDAALVHKGAIPKTKRERTHACLDVGGLCKLFARSARRVARFAGCHSRERRPVHKASARCSSPAAAYATYGWPGAANPATLPRRPEYGFLDRIPPNAVRMPGYTFVPGVGILGKSCDLPTSACSNEYRDVQ